MIRVKCTDPDGKETLYLLPETAKDVTCEKVIAFQKTIDSKKPATLQAFTELPTEKEKDEYFQNLEPDVFNTEWIGHYCRELHFWGGFSPVHLGQIPVDAEDGADIFTLRKIIMKALTVDKPEKMTSFQLNGHNYTLPSAPINMIDPTQKDYMRGVTLGQFATANELYRTFTMMQGGECIGLLHQIALLCLRDGEQLPIAPDEQATWITARVEELKALDFHTAMSVGFFLALRIAQSRTAFQYSMEKAKQQGQGKSMVTILQSEASQNLGFLSILR